MQNTDYRESLEDAVRALHQAEIELFTAMVNVGFKGNPFRHSLPARSAVPLDIIMNYLLSFWHLLTLQGIF